MRDPLRSVCYRSPASPFWAPRILRRNEGLSVGCAPDGPTKRFWVLRLYRLETFLSSACLEWLYQTPCSYKGYLGVSTLHTFKINRFLASSSTDPGHHNFGYDIVDNLFKRCAFQDPIGYPRILDIVDLRPLRGWHTYKASSRSALPDSLQLCQEI
jgi:hypothetical protein